MTEDSMHRTLNAALARNSGPSAEDMEALKSALAWIEANLPVDNFGHVTSCSAFGADCGCVTLARRLAAHTAAAEARLGEAVKDLCWRAVRYGETDDGDTAYYLVTKGTMHRLVVAAQNAGVPATFRADDTKVIDDIAEAETRIVQAVETVLADWSPTYLRDDIDTASEVASTMAAELRAAHIAAREAAARIEGGA